ncbi:MAG TPA: hypothetical protein VM364_08410 [Vicinamibacterales bacterium]|nr:hypothetical protein [Vicinamibacterales bacterium]
MDHPIVREQTPAEYFKELVDSALAHQRVQAGDLTAYYLVNLLCQFVRLEAVADVEVPLALRLGRALESAGVEQRARLRSLGDFSLFVTGFFSDSLNRKTVDVDYYVSMGEYAYGSLSRRDADSFSEVFADLATRFVGFADVLSEVSERSALRSSTDVLRLYEKWLRTGSTRDGQKLIERGIVPNSSIKPRVQ